MFKRSNFFKIAGIMLMSMMIGSSLAGASVTKYNELDSSNVTLLTNVTPNGEEADAIVCDFGEDVDTSNLSQSSFTVELNANGKIVTRAIKKVYTNDSVAISNSSKRGKYVVIELDSSDSNASTMTFTMSTFLNSRDRLNYTVTQKTDITTSDKVIFKASDKKVADGKVITPVVDDFGKFTYTDNSGNSLNYRFFEPKTEKDKKYPLVLFLHGSGERGYDNTLQLTGNMGGTLWATPDIQAKNPCYVLAPQVKPTGVLNSYWILNPTYDMVVDLVKETIKNYPIDPDRVYVTGMSNGGVGTWNIVKKNPDLFAAAVPICGASGMSESDAAKAFVPPLYYPVNSADVEVLKNIPIWAFAAADDPLVDPRNSREITAAIKAAGGTQISYTEYPADLKIGHGSWVPAYQNQDMINWLFGQSKER